MIPPNIAILEPQIAELGAQLKLGSDEWFAKRGIEVFDKGICWLLNKAKDSPLNHWNILCNSTLFAKHNYLISLPPIKLYQLNDTKTITLSKSHLIEKVGGHMICVCWPYAKFGEPVFHTQYRVSTYGDDVTNGSILSEAKKRLLAQLHFSSLYKDNNHTFTFQYDFKRITLVHARNIATLHEYDEDELDDLAESLFADRPSRICVPIHKVSDIYDIIRKTKKKYIVRDIQSGERADVTLPVTRSKLVSTLQWKYLVPYWIAGERYDVEYSFPAAKEKFDKIEDLVRKRTGFLCETATKWAMLNLTPEGLAQSLKHSNTPRWSVRIVIKLCKLHPERWQEAIANEFRKMVPKKLITVLGLED